MYLCKYCPSISINFAVLTQRKNKTSDLSEKKIFLAASRLVLSYCLPYCHGTKFTDWLRVFSGHNLMPKVTNYSQLNLTVFSRRIKPSQLAEASVVFYRHCMVAPSRYFATDKKVRVVCSWSQCW